MNRLAHKISSKSLTDRDARGRDEGRAATPAERAQSEAKPSLLQRLRRNSRSKVTDEPTAATAVPPSNEVSHSPCTYVPRPPRPFSRDRWVSSQMNEAES
jgi:hypothetical protein